MNTQIKKATVKWFNQSRGFGFLLTEEGKELWFHAADRRVLKGDYNQPEVKWEWIPSPTAEPSANDVVFYIEGEDAEGRAKASLWSHAYDELEYLVARTGTPLKYEGDYRILWQTKRGTIVYPRNGWGKIFEKRVDTVDFEATREQFENEVINFVPAKHPNQQFRIAQGSPSYPVVNSWNWFETMKPGDKGLKIGSWGHGSKPSGSGGLLHEWIDLEIVTKDEQYGHTPERIVLFANYDGTVSPWTCANGGPGPHDVLPENFPHTMKLLEELGIQWVPYHNDTPVTEKDAISANFDAFCKRYRPTSEREAELLKELREQYGWGVYPPETPVAAMIVLPVVHVYSDIAKDYGKHATEITKVAMIGVYDPACVKEWEAYVSHGYSVQLHGSFGWGPGTSVFADHSDHPLPQTYDKFTRLVETGHMTDNKRWDLLAYGKDEDEMAEFRKRFEALNAISGTGAVMVIGAEGRVGATNIMG